MAVIAHALTTLTKVKTYLGISASTWDTLLETLIDGCTEWLENEMGNRRIFDSGSDVTEYYDGDFDGTGRKKIFLRKWPINSITSVSYNSGTSGTPVWTAYTTDDYTKNDNTGVLYFGSLPKGRQNIRVVYKGGYTTIPQDIDLACQKLVAKEFDKRKSQGVTSEAIGGASVSWNENADPSVLAIIRKHARLIR